VSLPVYYDAHAFHPDLGNEMVEGKVHFSPQALRFQAGEIALEIPLDRLEVRLGESEDERVFFTDSEHPSIQIISLERKILHNAAISEVRQQLEEQVERGDLWKRLKVVGYFSVGCVVVVWLGLMALSFMVRSLVAQIPASWEAKVGEEFLFEFKEEFTLVDDTNAVARLAELAAPLLRVLPTNGVGYKFYLVDEFDPNAFAIPGGHIFVTEGLLELVEKPEELLGVIAHEVAHVTEKHGFRDQIASAGPILIMKVFMGRGGAAGLLAGGSAFLASQSYSQDYEIEADDTGWKYLVKANIDPRGMISVFQKMDDWDPIGDFLPQSLSSHPAMKKRIERLENRWKKTGKESGFMKLAPLDKALKRNGTNTLNIPRILGGGR
jgi:Zn-dependent protease with chaperone function